jgi:hypothetical protein
VSCQEMFGHQKQKPSSRLVLCAARQLVVQSHTAGDPGVGCATEGPCVVHQDSVHMQMK